MDYTKYEKARILGARSLQLAMGAPAFVETDSDDPMEIAEEEMRQDRLPVTVAK